MKEWIKRNWFNLLLVAAIALMATLALNGCTCDKDVNIPFCHGKHHEVAPDQGLCRCLDKHFGEYFQQCPCPEPTPCEEGE